MNGVTPLRPQRFRNDRSIESTSGRGLRLFASSVLTGAEAEGRIGRCGLCGSFQQVEEAKDFFVANSRRSDQLVERLPQKLAQRSVEKRDRKPPIGRQYPVGKGLI